MVNDGISRRVAAAVGFGASMWQCQAVLKVTS
jgi:hypothetical protein